MSKPVRDTFRCSACGVTFVSCAALARHRGAGGCNACTHGGGESAADDL